MALDKVVDSAVLDAGMTTVADAIRAKAGLTDPLVWPDGFKMAVDGIQSGSASGIYMAKITPSEDLASMAIAHNLGTTDILLVACWAESLGDIVPATTASFAKFWAKTDIATQRAGNGFSPGYRWDTTNQYAIAVSPNTASYETLTIKDGNNISLPMCMSGTSNRYLAGVTYTVIVIAANAEV